MRYIFYADVYFIQNFMVKAAVLYLVLSSCKKYLVTTTIKGFLRIVIVAGIVTFFEIIGLLIGTNYKLFLVIANLFEIPMMFKGILGKERSQLFKIILLGYFYLIMINGVLEALWNQFDEYGSYIFYVLFSCGAVIVGVRIWRNYNKMQKGIFNVQIWKNGKKIQAGGYYDSGNRLIDPYTGKGVHIVSEQLKSKLEILGMVYIPYKSLGNEEGMLEVYYIDELRIDGERGQITIQNCPVGVTKDKLFEGKNYEIILNEEVF